VHGNKGRAFAVYDMYTHIGDINATFCNIGFYGYRLNANSIKKLTVRHCTADYPVVLDSGVSFLIENLYIESNEKGILNIRNNS
jgi:uncharacterized membrane protein